MPDKDLTITSNISRKTRDEVFIRGKNLTAEILGEMSLGEFVWLELFGEVPTADQQRLFDALVIVLAEHGLTMNVAASRLTYTGSPEALQGAVAAGILGIGSFAVGSAEGCARMLYEAIETRGERPLDELARDVVAARAGTTIPGIGHTLHKPADPRATRLFEVAAETGFSGQYIELIQLIAADAERTLGKVLPINVTGGIAAVSCELGIPWRIVRGIPIMGRTIGLVAHLLEEQQNPIGRKLSRIQQAALSEPQADGGTAE